MQFNGAINTTLYPLNTKHQHQLISKQFIQYRLAIITAPKLNRKLVFRWHKKMYQLERRLEFKLQSNPGYKPKWTKSIKNEILVLF